MTPESTCSQLRQQLNRDRLPRHVAIIMDGNGRWARQRGLSRIKGHQTGAESVHEVVRVSRELGLQYLTLYAFSEENWQRPTFEVQALMQLLRQYLDDKLAELQEKQIALRTIGDLSRLPQGLQRDLAAATLAVPQPALVLTVALSYGSRSEIVRAARLFAAEVQAGRLQPQDLTPQLLARFLYTSDLPDPDLLIRTSGEYRLSNFLLWQAAYTELYFTETLWPDFREAEFLKALLNFQQRQRRFGLTPEQIAAQNY